MSSIKLPKRIANVYFKLQNTSRKLHQAASSIGFIGKCLHNYITPKFASVSGNFLNYEDKESTERHIMATHMIKHLEIMKSCMNDFVSTKNDLKAICGNLLVNLLLKRIYNVSRKERVNSTVTKNNKISRLIVDKVIHAERMKTYAPKDKE